MNYSKSSEIRIVGKNAKKAAQKLAGASGELRTKALAAMPEALLGVKNQLIEANAADLEDAEAKKISEPLLKRLEITDKVFDYMQRRLEKVAGLPDPVGHVLEGQTQLSGLRVLKVRVPIGVIGIIYESRPNVTTDAAAVCLRSGNAVVLRGGSEALRTNIVLADAMISAVKACNLPEHTIQIIRSPGHAAVKELLHLDQYVDVLIPRGGKGLIKMVSSESRIPVIKHYEGICHQYLAPDAPMDMAIELCINSKCQRVEVCNALETVLVDQSCAERLLPALFDAFELNQVECRGCSRTRKILPRVVEAAEEDWTSEYLAPIISIKIVDGLTEAVEHINNYGSGHTDGIVTESLEQAQIFVNSVDSASVLVNASTRLSGGGAYGMGAVVGISTDKIHARGPVGPNELTSYKWIAYGKGHLRD
jgi:glutamate-5-semialdehyde dehydrogenase